LGKPMSIRGEGASNKTDSSTLKEHTWHHLVLHYSDVSYTNIMLAHTGVSFEMPTLF
jgi:hypothetical protein